MQKFIKGKGPSRQLFETVNFAFMKIFEFLVKIAVFRASVLFFGDSRHVLPQWGWSPRKFSDNFWVLVSCKGRESLFSDLLEIRNNFSKIEWKKDHFFSKFYIQNWHFQGIKKLGDLATPQGFWKHLGVVKTQTKNCEKSVYCTTSHKGVADP